MKMSYKTDTIKNQTMTTLKSLLHDYRDDDIIDNDSFAHVLYNDGTLLFYPDDVEKNQTA